MSSLIYTDRNGTFTPAITLLFNSKYYNSQGVREVASILKKNYDTMASHSLQQPMDVQGIDEFCAMFTELNRSVSSADIIASNFFQNMVNHNQIPSLKEKIIEHILPSMIGELHRQFPQSKEDPHLEKVKNWIVGLLASYLSSEDIEKFSITSTNEQALLDKRKELGVKLNAIVDNQKITAEMFVKFISSIKTGALSICEADPHSPLLDLAGQYLQLIGLYKNPVQAAEEITSKLEKFFLPKVQTTTM